MRLKILASVVFVLILGYVFFWHYMAGEVEEKFVTWVKQQKGKGVIVNYKGLEITGFPYRIEVTFNDLSIVRPGRETGHETGRETGHETGHETAHISLFSPHIMLVAFPWNITHGLIFSDEATVYVGRKRHPALTLNIGKIRASANIDIIGQRLQRASLVMAAVSWETGEAGQSEQISSEQISVAREVRLHIMQPEAVISPAQSNDMELPILMKIYLEAKDVVAQELSIGIFGKKADQVKIDLQLHGEQMPRFSRESLRAWRDGGGTVDVKNFSILSRNMDMILDGEATLDQDLKPLGAFAAKIHGITHIVGVLSAYSAFQQAPGAIVLQELQRMSKQADMGSDQKKDVLDLAISLQGGLLFLGPIPVYELEPVVK